jgi:hypothetical protein
MSGPVHNEKPPLYMINRIPLTIGGGGWGGWRNGGDLGLARGAGAG